MKKRELLKYGFSKGEILKAAQVACGDAANAGIKKGPLRQKMKELARDPDQFLDDPIFGPVASLMVTRQPVQESYDIREEVEYPVWGDDIDPDAHRQMRNACSLPISLAGALMPDAHVGYGLPIGGVLATDNAVIPYAVGVDIACRVKMTVFESIVLFRRLKATYDLNQNGSLSYHDKIPRLSVPGRRSQSSGIHDLL